MLPHRRAFLAGAATLLLSEKSLALGGLISGLAPTTPLRIIADRITPPNQLTAPATATQAMSRTSHTSTSAITTIGLIIGNYYTRNWNGGGAPNADTGPGASMTVTASIEYPAGTLKQITFGGSATGTIANNDLIVSDIVALSIPNGTQFWTRTYQQCSAGIVTSAGDWRTALGDVTRMGTSGIVDQTMSGTITNNSGVFVPPAAIIGTSTRPSVAIIGTSIAAGVGDNVDPGDVRHGFSRSLTTTPCVNLAVGSANLRAGDADDWIANHPIHAKLIPYCTSLLTDHGTNDYIAVSTAQCILNLTQRLYPLFAGKGIFQTTILQRVTSSSDGWITIANQSGQGGAGGSTAFSNQKALNVQIRGGGVAGITAVFDTDSVLESGFESGWWRVATDGSGNAAPFTLDGTHPTQSGQLAIRDSGVIDQTKFT